MSAAMMRTAPAGRTLRFITALSARLTCPKPNARPIRHNARVPDRNGKIFYTSITSLSHISKLAGLIDIYLIDSKYYSPEVSLRYSKVNDYFKVNLAALKEAFSQQPKNLFDNDGILKRGVIVRHLVLPSNTSDSRKLLKALKENFSENITVSLMCQYTPLGNSENFTEINRRLKRKEFKTVYDFLLSLGYKNGYIQSFSSADNSYVSNFDIIDIYE